MTLSLILIGGIIALTAVFVVATQLQETVNPILAGEARGRIIRSGAIPRPIPSRVIVPPRLSPPATGNCAPSRP